MAQAVDIPKRVAVDIPKRVAVDDYAVTSTRCTLFSSVLKMSCVNYAELYRPTSVKIVLWDS